MNLSSPIIHEVDTRLNSTLTVFDGSREDESKLAKQFWNSVVLMPPVESTLVCKEIKQCTKSRPFNDGKNKARLSTAMTKANQEKTLRNQEYEEIAALKEAEDEGKRIQSIRERHQQLRHLFFKQARINRLKHQEWAIPHMNKYSMSSSIHGSSIYYRDATDNGYNNDENNDRQLVRSLPD
ncbi:unnamed protein product [Rotaria socialis]|uniref:Cilia- and flagella-associated protein HOATZ n=1 Tax=Rotaria socialis TaxID=392032 RepID=A0A819X5T7_9BILA|nr:unnamed protein product [Rotaria socialis]CAF3347937.1 unnamed protein product [Rotaria socialis]CAF3352866.1 unnamed protein product [Rotaria socialis]CAF3534284.1 unnamed protein product [Rotaria socialis]CAF3599016.1 unnamed protein product [Rotaria socialis]